MAPERVALVVNGEEDDSILRILREVENYFEITAVIDISGEFTLLSPGEKESCYLASRPEEVSSLTGISAVIIAVEDEETVQRLNDSVPPGVEVITPGKSTFFRTLFRAKEELIEAKRLKGELWAILNSVQDAIEVADREGVIKYINPAFTRVTGIPEAQRVGANIFEVSPHGALASSLIYQKPVTGYRTIVGGSDVEVISNASPIVVDGEIEGAVVVFQPVTDILKLMEKLEHSNTIIENLYAQINRISGVNWSFEEMVGKSKNFKPVVEMARKASRSDKPVVIEGEPGTGKEVLAQSIHRNSSRQMHPFIKLDTSSVPESLLEMELFGCEKDAYPGKVRTRLGKIEIARGGTLYIEGVCQLNHYLQEKLLQCLREGSFCRIGGEEPVRVEVRLVVSSYRGLKRLVRQGKFREDLYLALNNFELNLPPLRQRVEDIPLIVDSFINQLNRKLGKNIRGASPQALQHLLEYEWPGNIPELWNVIERAAISTEGHVIKPEHLDPYITRPAVTSPGAAEIIPLDKMEEMMLKSALAHFGENLEGKKKAAKALNISLATLYNKLKKYQVHS